MRRSLTWLVAAVVAVPAAAGVAQLPQPVINALTPIDSLPSSQQIDDAHGGSQQALANLQEIALAQGTVDIGVQLRAVRALTQYCADPCGSHDAHATLVTLAGRYDDAVRGNDLLVLRATVEALGVLRVASDLDLLTALLGHPSRDIRAATAYALRDLGNAAATTALSARYQVEQIDQVRVAISDALRVLGQPVP